MSIYRFPDGSLEGTAYVKRGQPSGDESWWSALSDDERSQENRIRVGRRAGRQIRRLCRSAGLRRLLTFTNGETGGEGFRRLRDAQAAFKAWFREWGWLLGETPVVVVAEYGGKLRRIHLHVAIGGDHWLPYSEIIATWSETVTSLGFISRTGTHAFHAGDDRGKHQRFSSARVCGDYMASYLSKGFGEDERLEQERRYLVWGVTVGEPRRMAGFNLGDVPALVADTFGVPVTPFYDGEGVLSGYWFDTG